MKKQEDLGGIGYSSVLTIIFVVMAIVTYQTDEYDSFTWIPCIFVIVGIYAIIRQIIEANKRKKQDYQQQNAAKSIRYDSCFGQHDLRLYFDSSTSKVTICLATTNETKQEEVSNFVRSNAIETECYIIAIDSTNHKILRTNHKNGTIEKKICNLHDELKLSDTTLCKSTFNVKTYNDYVLITDDINEFIAIVTPTNIHVHHYSDIVSISYEENGSDVFNKSIGGAVVGGLLLGGVGAIVGSNTAKATQNKEVRNMSIKILLRSTSNSTIVLKIYEGFLETKNYGDRIHYEKLMQEVSEIKDIFSIIIDIVDKKSYSSTTLPTAPPTSTISVADELEKLAKLKEAGILSEEEFNEQKVKLLKI